ncbi:MAG: FHA domain-containing protein [Archangium sp.]
MPPPRKVTRGTGAVDDDPERENRTHARALNPVADSDPERENKTQARVKRPAAAEDADPEREQSTQARVKNPLSEEERTYKSKIRARVPQRRPEEDYDTAGEYADEGGYQTGQNYQAAGGEEEDYAGLSPSISLEGDGLEALDPEIGSRTKALPALEVDDAPAEQAEEADDANATRAGPPLKIEITAGPDAGKKKKFKGVRMVIGRTPGVDLQLSDQSVSRRHVELIYGDDGVMLKDLGSGNGTKVNGTKVAEKKLEHGDEIHIGKTKMKFVDELAAFKKAREEQEAKEAEKKAAAEKKEEEPKTEAGEEEAKSDEKKDGKPAKTESGDKKPAGRQRPVRTARNSGEGQGGFAEKFKALPAPIRLAIVGGVVVVLIIFIAGIALRPPPPAPVEPARLLADSKMQEARNAVREEDYGRAAQLVDDAEKLVPGIDKTKLGQQAKAELAFRVALDDAKKAIGEKRFEDAKKALDATGKGSIKSEEAKVKVREELKVAETQYKKEQIEELVAAGEIEGAKNLLAELPVEMQSEPARAIAEFETQLEEQKKQEEADAKEQQRRNAIGAQQRREEAMNEAFVVVERKFGGGEWERAASECSRVLDAYSKEKDIATRAKKLQGLIPTFGRNYDEGMKKYRQGQLAQAAKPLRVAHQTYVTMGLRANKYGQELEEKIGAAAVVAGKEALLRSDLVTAWQNFRDAAKFDPNDSKARAGLDDVTAKAELLFQDAYMTRDRDPLDAVRKFKVVVQVTEAGSTVHEKAKNQLAAMAP